MVIGTSHFPAAPTVFAIAAERSALCYTHCLVIMEPIKAQLKTIILKSLRITGVSVDELRDDQPLLRGDFEIDSIDILQLILDIERHFGIKLVTGKFDDQAWASVNTLA